MDKPSTSLASEGAPLSFDPIDVKNTVYSDRTTLHAPPKGSDRAIVYLNKLINELLFRGLSGHV